MKDSFTVVENNFSFEDYFATKNVSENVKEKLFTSDIVAVPIKRSNNNYYFAQETIDFIKYCRQHDSEHAYDVLADDVEVLSLHSFDIWMPVLYIASNYLLPVALGLVSNYIWDKLKGREKEPANVDVTFIVEENGTKKTIHYSGDAKTFQEKFEKIDINNL